MQICPHAGGSLRSLTLSSVTTDRSWPVTSPGGESLTTHRKVGCLAFSSSIQAESLPRTAANVHMSDDCSMQLGVWRLYDRRGLARASHIQLLVPEPLHFPCIPTLQACTFVLLATCLSPWQHQGKTGLHKSGPRNLQGQCS